MKKLVFAALAIGAMAACTKSSVQYEQPGEICLQPVAQKATKAAVDGTVYPTSENFNVWANWGNIGAGTVSATNFTTAYINNGTFTNRGGNNWGGTPSPYYWPTTGSLIFAGYSPASPKGGNPTFEYNFSDNQFKVTGYIQSTDIRNTDDLMWFDFDGKSYNMNVTSSDGEGNTVTTGIPAKFQHALSWLTFQFKLKDESTPENWTITGITLQGIKTKGDFDSKPASGSDQWVLSSDTGFTEQNITVYGGEGVKITRNTTVTPENVQNGVVVIPQSCAADAVSLLVTYKLTTQAQTEVPQEVQLYLSEVDDQKWEVGKHYIYTIIFGANEILISPDVTDWTPVNVDVNVQ